MPRFGATPGGRSLEQQAFEQIRRGDLAAAAPLYRLAIQQGQASPAAFSNLAAIELSHGQPRAARDLLQQALRLSPGNPEAWLNLGSAHHALGDYNAAAEAFRQAATLRPDFAKAHANLGNTLQALNDYPAAIEAYRQALRIEPRYPEALSNLGIALRESGQPQASIAPLQQALALRPAYPEALNNLGLSFRELGRLDDAVRCYEQAITLAPQLPEIFSNLGVTRMEQGNLPQAVHCYEQALELNPHYPEAHRHLAYCLNGLDSGEALQRAEASLQVLADHPDRYHLQFAIGKYRLDRGDPDALSVLIDANRLRSEQLRGSWQLPRVEDLLERNASLIGQSAPVDAATPLPNLIFIVGLPRSGSTLVETILSQCSALVDLGEVPYLQEAINSSCSITEVQQHYLRQLRHHPRAEDSTAIFTDKYLYNFSYCPILRAAFPTCRIIHVHRNPMDNLLSTFTNHFARGNEWTYDLEDSVRFYAVYRQVMAAHEQAHPGSIHPLNYDVLTHHPEQEVRRLIEHCALPWSDAFLHPEQSTRSIQTASAVQARRPIRPHSVGGWRRHAAVLQPYADQLERLGYSTAIETNA